LKHNQNNDNAHDDVKVWLVSQKTKECENKEQTYNHIDYWNTSKYGDEMAASETKHHSNEHVIITKDLFTIPIKETAN